MSGAAAVQLDPGCALLVIDLQNGIVALPTVHSAEAVVERARVLAEAFRRHRRPVVLVAVAGPPPGRTERGRASSFTGPALDLVAALGAAPEDHRVVKRAWGAFSATGLDSWLRERGVTQVVLAGIATSIGVESTARQAFDLGFSVTLVVDAMTDLSAEAHDNSLRRIFPRLGQSVRSEDLLALLP